MTSYDYKGFTIQGEYLIWRIFKNGKQPFASRLLGETFDSEQACKNMIDSSLEMKARQNLGKSFEKLKSIIEHEDWEQQERDREEQKVNDFYELENLKLND